MPKPKNDILQGTLAMLVLRTLATRGALHGYAVTQHIQQGSNDLLRVEEGSLYPALHRMEQDGWIRGQVGHHRQEPAGQVLCDHRRRPEAARGGGGELEPPHGRRRPRAAIRLTRDTQWPGTIDS